ncbi:potassium voltage-gated channel subfamily E regulatory beta subunit 5 [Anolis carolinensis]|uniref:Potassium voltage-gated channel subfamily E regulatory subunit 5 n=1 Tax=Anolis carolinensis TaxID=28377 RepID=H9GJ38_ANOCA|nr:PREDICTED: potassium voltage-gated channel subfamily E regulatory beta subunit 5 [Anolis carolinensis]|eukprot:XP_008112892.1 PREDICTED: potassium voltage-gated channel subfamily E regulatory beta subunit 5 [Anolis carolinensis]
MNCSESRRLHRLLIQLWQELHGGSTNSSPILPSPLPPKAGSSAQAGTEDDAYLYILLIMIFYGCLAGGLILAYTRSRKLESKHDPYHLYIERDWAAGGSSLAGGAKSREGGLEEGEAPSAEIAAA